MGLIGEGWNKEEVPFFCPFSQKPSTEGEPEDNKGRRSPAFARSFLLDRELRFSYIQPTP
jgi:hypothetical protein